MPLALAIKNQDTLVVATDTNGPATDDERYGQLIPLPNRAVLLIVGNLGAVRHAVMDIVLPKVRPDLSAAGLAQLVQAALVVDVVPNLAKVKGRVELIVAGIDPVRHIEQPGLYYMDSARDFYLQVVDGDAIAAGSTAAVTALTAGHRYTDAPTDRLRVLAKECLAATKLRWPSALGGHVRLAVITPEATQIQDY